MADFSFDIVSEFDKSEMNNVFDQTQRELASRYDFKGTAAQLEWRSTNKDGLRISGDSQYQVEAILDIYRKKLAARGMSQKILDSSAAPTTRNLTIVWEIGFKAGLSSDLAKKISASIRDTKLRIKSQIQGDSIRVSAQKKDDLQAVIRLLSEQNFDTPLQFVNYR